MGMNEAEVLARIPGAGQEGPLPGARSAEQEARRLYDAFRRGKDRKSLRDLTAEKYMLHVDGEGGAQWADIVNGTKVRIPPRPLGGLRVQYNLLRPVVDNAIAYHTAQQFKVTALAPLGRKARDTARIDSLFANDFLQRQNVNLLTGQALWFAFSYGFCPIHVQWRNDLASTPYEPIYASMDDYGGRDAMPRSGLIDCYLGNPWETVFNEGARRGSYHTIRYARSLPASAVRKAFQHVPGIEAIEGNTKLPSASTFQRVLNRWGDDGMNLGGTALINGIAGDEEILAIVCEETLPGMDPQWPMGRLTVIALAGAAEAPGGSHSAPRKGRPILLHQDVLPGGVCSMVPLYATLRGDDPYGKPWVADMDEAQIQINQLLTHAHEFVRRFARPPLVTMAGSLADDTVTTEDDAILEVTDATISPSFLLPPAAGGQNYLPLIREWKDYLYQVAGWQAASRGESRSGDPASKVAMLAEMDDTVHAPINQALRAAVVQMCQTAHSLAREYMDVPWLVDNVVGEDMAYLARPYITREMLSPRTPNYVVTSGYGATPEETTQKLLQYLTMSDAAGTPLLTAEEFWRRNPDQTVKDPQITAQVTRTRRAKQVNEAIYAVAEDLTRQFGDMALRFMPQAIQMVMAEYPPLPDDIPQQHVEALSEITQDPSVNRLARQIATERQKVYYQIIQQAMAAQAAQATAGNNRGEAPAPRE